MELLEHDLWTQRDDIQVSLLNEGGGAESLPVLSGTVVLTQAGPSASDTFPQSLPAVHQSPDTQCHTTPHSRKRKRADNSSTALVRELTASGSCSNTLSASFLEYGCGADAAKRNGYRQITSPTA